jgi:hypothetical protein
LKDFLTYLEEELNRVVKTQIDDFKNQSDTLSITRTLSKEKITTHLAACETTAKAAFEASVANFSATHEDAKTRVTEARNNLASGIADYHIAKLLLLDALVNKWNRQALNRSINEVLAGVVDFTLDTPEKLEEGIRKAKMSYFGEACGETTKQAEVSFHDIWWSKIADMNERLGKPLNRDPRPCTRTFGELFYPLPIMSLTFGC